MMSKMPVIDLSKADPQLEGRDLVACLGRESRLRASKPDPKKDGEAAWVWRMAALDPNPQHHCMPVMADFDLPFWSETLPGGFCSEENNERRKAELQRIVGAIRSTVPVHDWHGVRLGADAVPCRAHRLSVHHTADPELCRGIFLFGWGIC